MPNKNIVNFERDAQAHMFRGGLMSNVDLVDLPWMHNLNN